MPYLPRPVPRRKPPLAKNVYAVFDYSNSTLYQFAHDVSVTPQNAVQFFLSENSEALFGVGFYGTEDLNAFSDAVKETSTVEALTQVMNDWDFYFTILLVE